MRSWNVTLAVGILLTMLMVEGTGPWQPVRALAQGEPPCATNTPLPEAFKVATPSADTAGGPAGWSGAFEGIWDGNLPSRLVIERIDGARAHIVYTWGDEPSGAFRAGFSRFAATLREDGAIQWGPESDRFVFRQEGDTVLGELTRQSNVYRATMQRCSVAAMAVPPELTAAPDVGAPVYAGPFTGPGLAATYRCSTGRNSAEIVGEGYMHKVSGRCQEGQNFSNAGSGALKALQMGDGELRFEYKAVNGRDRLQLQARLRLQDHPSNSVGYVIVVQPGQGSVQLRRQSAPNDAVTLDGRPGLADRLDTDDWVVISARALGPNLFVFLSDEPILAAYDTTFDRGSFQVATIRLGNIDDPAETAVVLRRSSSWANVPEPIAPWHDRDGPVQVPAPDRHPVRRATPTRVSQTVQPVEKLDRGRFVQLQPGLRAHSNAQNRDLWHHERPPADAANSGSEGFSTGWTVCETAMRHDRQYSHKGGREAGGARRWASDDLGELGRREASCPGSGE
jgi:hypothetical protein